MRDRLLRSLQRSAAVLVAGALVGLLAAAPAAADDPVFTLSDDRISSPTGIATDTATSSYWMVSQSGARVVALSRTGQVKGVVEFRAQPVDVEAAAYRSGRLYVGDVGDPDGNREMVSVYLFPNLTADAGTVTYQSWDFSYPDGARDAKAIVVDPTGRLFIITTGDRPGVYAAPAQPTRQGVNALTRVGDAPSGVTDAVALSADQWAVRTGTTVEVIDADSFKKTADAKLPVSGGDVLGTALGGSSTTGLVAASSGTSARVYAVAAPTPATSAPSSSAGTPRPSAGASTTAGTAADPAEDSAADSSRRGTVVAIVLAALVALVAGAIVFLVPGRRRTDGGAKPVKPAPPARGARIPPAEHPVPAEAAEVIQPAPPAVAPTGAPPSPAVWPETQAYYGAARSSVDPNRHRAPGDIEDDDPFDDTTVRADQLPGRRAESVPPVAPTEPPRRSLGYDPELWGEDTLRRRPGDPGDPGTNA